MAYKCNPSGCIRMSESVNSLVPTNIIQNAACPLRNTEPIINFNFVVINAGVASRVNFRSKSR